MRPAQILERTQLLGEGWKCEGVGAVVVAQPLRADLPELPME